MFATDVNKERFKNSKLLSANPDVGPVYNPVFISTSFQVPRGKPLKFKRLEDFLKDSHKRHRDDTRIQRAEHRPPAPLPPAKNRLAFAVRIRE